MGYTAPDLGGLQQTFILHWDGSQWSQVPSPNRGTAYCELYGVTAVGANDAWAVGSCRDSGIYATLTLHWDGLQWNDVASPNPASILNELHGVAAVGSTDVWAVGYREDADYVYRTLVEHWNGTQWTVVPSPNQPPDFSELVSISIAGPTDIWAVGQYWVQHNPQPLVLHWDGLQWSLAPSPIIGISTSLSGVAAVAPGDIWAVGQSYDGNALSTLALHWDGVQWSRGRSPNPSLIYNSFNGVAAVAASNVWAVGWYAPDVPSNQILMARYAGPCGTATPTRTPTVTRTATSTATGTPPTATPTATVCALQFADVAPSDPFYPYIRCLACRGIVTGYACGGPGEPCNPNNDPYYRPTAYLTRGQLAKMVALAAGFADVIPTTQQTFTDVPNTAPFWLWIEQLAGRGVINGYTCGVPPIGACDPQHRPYFLAGNPLTRGQLMKIVANSAGLQAPVPTTQQTFQDVVLTHPFWLYIERLADQGIISGYQCGGPGGPCDPPENRPYLRVNNLPTRAQMAKVVTDTFFPNCQTPARRR